MDDIQRVYPGAYSDFYKQNPLPNPKVQVEQMKMQAHKMKIDYEKWKVVVQLQADQLVVALAGEVHWR